MNWHPDPTIDAAIESIRGTHPYYLPAVSRLRIIEDANVPTMATSALWVTHYNSTFAKSLTAAQCGAVIVHELEHLLRRHHDRCADRDPGRFNVAGDAEINQRLDGLPDGAVYPESIGMPRGRTAEVYYGATEAKPEPQPGDGDGGEGDGEGGSSADGEGQPNGGGTGSGTGKPQPGTAKCGSAAGGPIQSHEQGDAKVPGAGAVDGGKAARREVAEAVMSGAGRGADPELREWAETELGIDRAEWYRAISAAVGHVMSPLGAPTRWQWPGRREMRDMGGAMVPRWTGERPSCAVVLDTSGSITPMDLDMAVAAGHYLARMADVTFYACSTQSVRLGAAIPPGRLPSDGGTDMRVGIAMAIAEGAKAVVVITDCETAWPQEYTGVPVIVGANPKATQYVSGEYARQWRAQNLTRPVPEWGNPPPEWMTVLPVQRP